MKERFSWIEIWSVRYNFLLIIIFIGLIGLLIHDYSPAYTGPIGDTFGGLLSPVIGVISIYFIYETFNAQREQLVDQKKQFDISRVTDIVYFQIQRIDQTIDNQTFYPQGGIVKSDGITGLHGLNEVLEEVFDSRKISEETGLDVKNEDLDYYMSIINSNLKQLTHMYGVISNSFKIIDGLIHRSLMQLDDGNDIKALLIMNLGDTINLTRWKLSFVLNDAQNLPNYDWQNKRLHAILKDIEKHFNENE